MVALGTKFDKSRKYFISKKLHNIIKNEFGRSLFEVSGLAEAYLKRNFSELYNKYRISFDDAKLMLHEDEIRKVDNYRYERKIGSDWYEKILLGTINKRY